MSDIIAGVQCPAFVAVDFNVRPSILLEFNVRHYCWNLPLDFPSVWICDAVLNFWRWYSIFRVTSDFVKVQVMQAKIIWTRNTLRFDLFKKINVTNLIQHLLCCWRCVLVHGLIFCFGFQRPAHHVQHTGPVPGRVQHVPVRLPVWLRHTVRVSSWNTPVYNVDVD